MLRKKSFILLIIVISAQVFFSSCKRDKSPLQSEPDLQWMVDTTLIPEMVAQVDSERIWSNMLQLTSYPERNNFRETIDEVREWLSAYVSSAGLTYEIQRYFGYNFDFYFSSSTNGLAYAIPDIGMHTSDGGLIWEKIALPYNPEFQFFDEQNGYLSSHARTLFKSTNDGGKIWNEINNNFAVRLMHFMNKNVGWGADLSELYKTEDGGNNWSEVHNFGGFLYDLLFWDDEHAIISSESKIYKTSNGWNSWTEITNVPTGNDLVFVNSSVGFMKNPNHTYYFTNNGGNTWTDNHPVNTYSITDLVYIKPNHLWGLANGKIWHSSNQGQNWTLRNTYKGENSSLFFSDSLNGWLCTTRGIFKTINGGFSWTDQMENIPENITWENIIVTIPGKIHPEEQILLIGHYDTYGISPGADDNASGISALLEYAHIFSRYNFSKTVKIIFFSGEESDLLGSKRYVELAKERGDNIDSVLNFDVIGYWEEGIHRDLNLIHNENSSDLTDTLIYAINTYTHTKVSKNDPTSLSDHKSFWDVGYPAVWFSEGGNYLEFNPYMNSSADIIEHVDKQFLFENIKAGLAAAGYLAKPVKQITKEE